MSESKVTFCFTSYSVNAGSLQLRLNPYPLPLPAARPHAFDKYFRFRKASPAQFVLLISHSVECNAKRIFTVLRVSRLTSQKGYTICPLLVKPKFFILQVDIFNFLFIPCLETCFALHSSISNNRSLVVCQKTGSG